MLTKNSLYLLSFYGDHENLSININRDITMMKHAQQLSLMNRSDSHRHTSSLARRAIFVLSLLVFCLGSVWGKTYTEIDLTSRLTTVETHQAIPHNAYSGYSEDSYFVFTFKANDNYQTWNDIIQYYAFSGSWNGRNKNDQPDAYVQKNGEFTKTHTISWLNDNIGTDYTWLIFNTWDQSSYGGVVMATVTGVKLYVPQDPFTGELPTENNRFYRPMPVFRSAPSVEINLKNEEQLGAPQYARFYLTDVNDNPIDPTGKLTVKYGDDDAMPCSTIEKGFYISTSSFDKLKINVKLASPESYKLYKVVCLFSDNTPTLDNDGKISQEPDFNLQYTYSFDYSFTTKKKEYGVDWRRNGMTPDASSNNPGEDWGISLEELAVEQYVKWYVTDGSGNQQSLALYSGSRGATWTIAGAENGDYRVDDGNKAVLTRNITSNSWDTWGKPTFYAPANMEYSQVHDYKIICEIYANNDGTGNPYVQYTFSLYKSFLGELKVDDESHHEIKLVEVKKGVTSLKLPLKNWINDAKYARIWLTTIDGTMIDPTGKLMVEGMEKYETQGNTDVSFGYYLANENGIDLTTIKSALELPLGTYTQYQLHVALSTDKFEIVAEPDYDYVRTFSFCYPVKTKYKTLIYNNNQCTPHLLKNWAEVAGDCGEGKNGMNGKLYVRWYLARITTDAEGNTTETPLNITLSNGGGYTKITNNNNGYYKFGGFNFNASGFPRTNYNNDYVPTITLPGSTNNYADVRLICVATTKTERYGASPWNGDPDEIQVKYVYTLKTEKELQDQPFVHYQGEAYRYLKEIGNDDEAEYYDYRLVGEDVANQRTWNILTNSYEDASNKKIRQNVHTVDYYYYVDDNKTDEVLLLPMQDYTGVGQDTEPRAYIRWYDFNTDMAVSNNVLQAHGWLLNLQQTQTKGYNQWGNQKNMVYNKVYVDYNRGLFGINFNKHVENNTLVDDGPTHKTIGVTFNAQNAFGEGKPSEYLIACDVSRYMDGMDESFTYLVHEPTLSIRYLFHIRPASVIANEMKTKAMANKTDATSALKAVEYQIMNRNPTESISILENGGRTVVSTNNGYGEFSLRTKFSKLGHYYIGNQEAKSIWWYAYCQDTKGKWWRRQVDMTFKYMSDKVVEGAKNGEHKEETIDRSKEYQAKYSMNDFQGSWEPYDDNGNWGTATTTATPSVGVNSHIQLVACVGAGTGRNIDNDIPIIWTELEFIDAKPLELGEETEERSVGYMNTEYGEPTTLDFNNFSLYGNRRPGNSYQNYATVPLRFEAAQYGLSYPQLYGLCFTTWDCTWNGYGMSPLHGDYLLLKSMGMDGISWDEDFDSQSMFCNWWNNSTGGKVDVKANVVLYDVTHEREHKEDKNLHVTPSDTEDYGGFLYVDAADEARTIASLEFDAELCSNARIYYTAYIASVCGNNYDNGWEQTPPMLRFRVTTDGKNGERIPVVTFVTGDIKREVNHDKGIYVGPNAEFKLTHWYQVYGYTTIPAEVGLDGKFKHYYVEIDNYCDDTDGADYCIDQISFYTTSARLRVKQSANRECNEDGISLNVYVSDKELQEQEMVGQPIYWRICDENGNPLEDEDLYKFDEKTEVLKDKDGKPYGVSRIPESYVESDLQTDNNFQDKNGYFKLKSDGLVYFSLANKLFKLVEGENYYFSVFELGHNPDETDYSWGTLDDICSVYSPVFVPKMVYVSVSDQKGNTNPTIEVACSDHTANLADLKIKMVVNVPDDTEETGFYQSKEEIKFDFFIGTEEKYNGYYIKLESSDKEWHLNEAIEHYRARTPGGEISWTYNGEGLHNTYKTYCEGSGLTGYYEVIEKAVEDGLLYLLASNDVKLKLDKENTTILALAINKSVKNSQGDEYDICTPLPLTFNVIDNLEDPSMMLGFKDVTYAKNLRVVRVGKKQLEDMQKADGYLLHIPVNKYQANNKETATLGRLKIVSEKLELLRYNAELVAEDAADDKWTNDSEVKGDNNIYVATFDKTEISGENPYISLNFHGSGVTSKDAYSGFKEGFTYRMFFQVKNGDKVADPKSCEANIEFLMKVVPEYVTWNDGSKTGEVKVTGKNQNENTNWNNDKNWSRSRKAELYKADTDDYTDNDNTTEGKNPRSFTPMKFTYVTIPSKNKAPQLVKLTAKDKSGIIDSTLINYTPEELATDSIEYDLMVMIDEENEECKHESGIANVYEVEKFYGNVCKEIYFKPEAELLYQQHLTYQKAWVEKELVANKWYLMSTPLKATYAGDMYVPYNTDVTKNGRQETEAFKEITMAKENGALNDGYSRTKYPIYQRSWGTAYDSKVIVSKNDAFRSDYSAALKYTKWTGNIAEWGHTFNDVSVDYTKMTGFSIRAHKKDQKNSDDADVLALIRLPKEDKSYDYYGYSGDDNAKGHNVSISKTDGNIGQLLTNEKGDKAEITLTLSENNLQQMDGYILVGNPYMASLDMKKFFDVNTNLGQAYYYTYEESKAVTNGVYGKIRPLQAFFVNKGEATQIVFNSSMMMDGNYGTPAAPNPAPAMRMTAANDRGQSTATVSVSNEAKTVETLFDSNLNDVPMVYTVANGQAMSINQLTELDKPIAFGVTCAASDEPVAVTFSDIKQLTSGEVYVVDAVTNERTAVGEGCVLTVQPNDYGRYFLVAGALGIRDQVDVKQGIVVSVRGRVVTVTSGEMLTEVRALSLDGATAQQATAGSTTALLTLATPGVYIIKAENVAGEQQTVKVVVK